MLENLSQELIKIKEEIRNRDRLTLRLNRLQYQLDMEKGKLQDFMKVLDKEEWDVKKLEKKNISNIIYNFFGNKEEKYEKEKREFLLAQIKVDECENMVASLERQISEVRKELDNLDNLEHRYEEIIRLKEKEIREGSSVKKTRLMNVSEEIADGEADIKELSEAITAGNNLLSIIERMDEALEKARSWGTFDMLGGGIISTSIKHSYIDEAREYAYKIKDSIGRFKRELSDVDVETKLDVHIGEFASFADYFFDGFFVDWYVQNSIDEAINNLADLEINVKSIIENLESEKQEINEKIGILKKEYLDIIEGS